MLLDAGCLTPQLPPGQDRRDLRGPNRGRARDSGRRHRRHQVQPGAVRTSGAAPTCKLSRQRYESREFPTFDEVISKFLTDTRAETKGAGAQAIEAAGLWRGRSGDRPSRESDEPAVDRGCRRALETARHPARRFAERSGSHRLQLVASRAGGDFALSIAACPRRSQRRRCSPRAPDLGEAILFWDGQRHVVASSEGGHTDFAPRTEQEIELLRYMKKQHEFVSVELILSGRGFRTIHEFLDPVRAASFL